MSRIQAIFTANQANQRRTLIPFITAGDPDVETTVKAMHALVAAGADIIELGIPYSDPMADGPVIQHASERALANGMNLSAVLGCVSAFRETNGTTAVVLMGYLNPIEAMGYQTFAQAAQQAGVDGVLVVDLPIDESQDLMPELKAAGIDPIILLAPTSTPTRIEKAMSIGQGYLYYVSFKGITGAAGLLDTEAVAQRITEIKAKGDLPIAVGFGIKNGESARQVAAISDAVVVGSALVRFFGEQAPEAAISSASALMATMRQAIDSPE